jgi:hypothetical protein
MSMRVMTRTTVPTMLPMMVMIFVAPSGKGIRQRREEAERREAGVVKVGGG